MILRRLNNLIHPKMGEVWMLHRVVEQRSTDPAQRVLEVTPDWLEQRILAYRQNGYRFVPVGNIGEMRKCVAITLDDGYRDNFTVALPLFRRLQVPFCVYVTTGFVDNQLPMWWYPGEHLGIGADELKALAADPLCTIGAHTVGHPHLDTLSPDAQRREIENSRRWLEALTQRPVSHFSYPHGAYNSHTVDICRELGFLTAVTTNGCTVRSNYKPLQLDRINIVQPD